jgi:hypothetical protein
MYYMEESNLYDAYVSFFSKEYEDLTTNFECDDSTEESIRMADNFNTIKRLLSELSEDCEIRCARELQDRSKFFLEINPQRIRTLYAEGSVNESCILNRQAHNAMLEQDEELDFVELTIKQARFVVLMAVLVTQSALHKAEQQEGDKF